MNPASSDDRREAPAKHVSRRRRWPRRLATASLALLLVGALGFVVSPRWRLIANIWLSGGVYVEQHLEPFHKRLLLRWSGKTAYEVRHVRLTGPAFDDTWLAEHDDLALLQPTFFSVSDSRLSRESIQRLLQKYAFESCYIDGVPVTDDDAAVLGNHPRLMYVMLRETEVTDSGLAALNVARLGLLDVGGSPVTATGLQTQIAGSGLANIGVDAGQFTPELATTLGSIPTLSFLILSGPEVTDAHLAPTRLIPRLRWLVLENTSVTEEAIKNLQVTHPNSALEVRVVPAP